VKRVLAGCVVALLPLWAAAQSAPAAKPVYALMALVGDKLDIVMSRAPAKALVRDRFELKDTHFDDVAIDATAKAIRRVDPTAELAFLRGSYGALYSKQAELLGERDGRVSIPAEILAAAAQQRATHLVLVGKQRATTEVSGITRQAVAGIARVDLEGLGFFVDVPMASSSALGALSPYAFLRVWVIDLQSRTVIGRKHITASSVVPVPAVGAEVAWQSLSAQQKVRVVEFLLRDEIDMAVHGIFELLGPG
jgi:hypothetical protein